MVEVQGPQAPVYQLQHHGESEIIAIKTKLQKIWKTLQSPSLGREQPQSRSQPDICWCHEWFGVKALKCPEPCKFQNPQGNLTASRWMQPTQLAPLYDKNTKLNFLIDTSCT